MVAPAWGQTLPLWAAAHKGAGHACGASMIQALSPAGALLVCVGKNRDLRKPGAGECAGAASVREADGADTPVRPARTRPAYRTGRLIPQRIGDGARRFGGAAGL